MAINSIYKLLDKLEMMILKGAPIPFSPFVTVNHEKLIDVLDKIRASIPSEVQEAHHILRKRDEIQMEAQRKAELMLTESQQQAETILSESELLKAVHAEAERIRDEVVAESENIRNAALQDARLIKENAIAEAANIREGADRYAESLLTNLDDSLTEMHAIVKNGQRHLATVKAAAEEEAHEEQPEPQEYVEPKELSYRIKR